MHSSRLTELVKEALANADENGFTDQLKAMTFHSQACDVSDGVGGLEDVDVNDVMKVVIQIRLDEDPFLTLNKLQSEGTSHRLLDPIHAIQFALHDYCEGLEFLRCWNEGDWEACASHWPTWLTFRS